MFCGSCMHDNTLAKAIAKQGVEIELVPTYTPIRTDENDFSVDQVFFGGINVYLQQKMPFLRFLPKLFDRFLDSPALIRRVTKNASKVAPSELGKLAVSMLKGEKGNQRKEVKRLCKWLAEKSNPDVIIFSNILIGGCIPEIQRELGVKTIVTLQGDDIFLDSLPEKYKQQCLVEIKRLVPFVDMFITHSEFYARFMSEYLSVPQDKIMVTPLGIDIDDFEIADVVDTGSSAAAGVDHEKTIGYLARLAPEKGLNLIVDAFIKLREQNDCGNLKLKIAGYLGPTNELFVAEQFKKLNDAGLSSEFEYVGAIDRHDKVAFLRSIDLLSVPTVYKEPKGLFVLEAMASGVAVVQPDHGAFPEVIEQTEGGLLFEAHNVDDLVEKLRSLLFDDARRTALANSGYRFVRKHRNSEAMASQILELAKSLTEGSVNQAP